jgi:hypothetical protein
MKIPFTHDQFFEVIKNYNIDFFPVQLILILLGFTTLIYLHSRRPLKNEFIGGILGILWLWSGIAYHLAYFTSINKAAFGFGAIFMLQGILFIYETFYRKNLDFKFNGSIMSYIGYLFIIIGLVIYPILLYFMKNSLSETIMLGLPCPTTIFTFGFMILTTHKFPQYLLIIPFLWTIVGTGAAIQFGVYPDYIMPVAALIATIYLLGRKRENKAGTVIK